MRGYHLTFSLLLLISVAQCKKKDGKKARQMEKSQHIPNVCDLNDQHVKLICNCDLPELNAATEASCFVYTDIQTDPVFSWSHLDSQSNIRQLKIQLRSGASLDHIPSQLFHHVRRLESLEIHYASIVDVPAYALANASHLKEVELARNGIATLELHAFSHLQNLQTLDLEENIITELRAMVFHHLPNLRKLFLSKNNLSIVHDNAFRFLNHLHELELNLNAISIVTRETFNGLFHLRRLDLRENKLTMLGDFTFAEMPELEELELESNELQFLSEKSLAGLGRLQRLRLSRNKLQVLSDDLFIGNKNLSFLDLRDNALQVLKFTTLEPIWDNFKNDTAYLLLEGNQFTCDCHISWTYQLRQETENKQIHSVLDELSCLPGNSLLLQSHTPLSSSEQQNDAEAAEYYDDDDVIYESLPEEPTRLQVLHIPPGDLPCPEPQVDTTTTTPETPKLGWFDTKSASPPPYVLSPVLCFIISVHIFSKTVFYT